MDDFSSRVEKRIMSQGDCDDVHLVNDLYQEVQRLRASRSEVIEECAKVADQWAYVCTMEAASEPGDPHGHEADADMAKTIATSIRSLKSKDTSNGK